MNVNLHIDSIVLDGLDLDSGQSRLLQQAVANELTSMLTQQGIGSAIRDSSNRASIRGTAIDLGRITDATTLGPQLANAIYASMPSQDFGSGVAQGAQP